MNTRTRFAKEIGIEAAADQQPGCEASFAGEFIPDTWGDGLRQAALSFGGA